MFKQSRGRRAQSLGFEVLGFGPSARSFEPESQHRCAHISFLSKSSNCERFVKGFLVWESGQLLYRTIRSFINPVFLGIPHIVFPQENVTKLRDKRISQIANNSVQTNE